MGGALKGERERWRDTADPIPAPPPPTVDGGDTWLPLTANPLHPGGSKPRCGQKKGSKVKGNVQEEQSWCTGQQNDLWHQTKRATTAWNANLCKASKALKDTHQKGGVAPEPEDGFIRPKTGTSKNKPQRSR